MWQNIPHCTEFILIIYYFKSAYANIIYYLYVILKHTSNNMY